VIEGEVLDSEKEVKSLEPRPSRSSSSKGWHDRAYYTT